MINIYLYKQLKMKILDWIINSNKWTWDYLSLNSNAIPLLEANPDKINWDMLSCNQDID